MFILKKIILWIYIKVHSILINISIALYNTETELLKVNPDDLSENKKKTTRKLHHNKLLEKFYAGQTDQKYVREYYELLKKADKFMRNANKNQKAIAADKWGMRDKNGRILASVSFFDEKHKNSGKTIQEVINSEMDDRRTKDDDYELLKIFNNIPIEVGLSKINKVVDDKLNIDDLNNKSKTFEFPLKISRQNRNIINKIEELTEFLHVKKIGFNHRQLEFFIPKKFKLQNFEETSDIFKEIITFDEVYIKDGYGELIGFNIDKYVKKVEVNDYLVLKFHGIEMETIKYN